MRVIEGDFLKKYPYLQPDKLWEDANQKPSLMVGGYKLMGIQEILTHMDLDVIQTRAQCQSALNEIRSTRAVIDGPKIPRKDF
jgi:hypothetical protein